MLAQERHRIILEMLQKTKIIKIGDIVDKFHVSVETARRDLEELESQNKLKRIYGGAISLQTSTSIEPFYSARTDINHMEKAAIGKKAAELVNDGETIILDAGTTTFEVAKNLKNKKDVTVLTSSLPILNELAGSDLRVYALGGYVKPREFSMTGPIPIMAVKQFYVDKAIIGAGGITFTEGVSDYDLEEAQIRKVTVERANKTILVADNSKFEVNAFAMVCPLESISTVITDWNIKKSILKALKERNIDVVIAEKEEEA